MNLNFKASDGLTAKLATALTGGLNHRHHLLSVRDSKSSRTAVPAPSVFGPVASILKASAVDTPYFRSETRPGHPGPRMQTIAWQKPIPLAQEAAAVWPSTNSFSSHLQRSGPADSRLTCRSRAAVSPPGACGRLELQPEASTSGRSIWQSPHCTRHPFFISNRTQTAASASTSADASTDAASSLPEIPLPNLPVRGKGLGSLALRIIFGTILGLLGAVVITAGGWLFTGAVCLVAYQATQEFFGFVTCKGLSEGQSPPSPIVSALTTAMCLGLSIWTHITHGRATAALAVASFAVLAVHVSLTEKPTTAQLASAVFGLFYCGGPSFHAYRHGLICMSVSESPCTV